MSSGKNLFFKLKIIAVSLPDTGRKLLIFMPLFALSTPCFGYYDGFKADYSNIGLNFLRFYLQLIKLQGNK